MIDVSCRLAACLVGFSCLVTSTAFAFPGPASVAVVYNNSVPESEALANTYVAARDVPPNQVCGVATTAQSDIPLADYKTQILGPLQACLTSGGSIARIEALMVIRGMPLRVQIPTGASSNEVVSLTAALGVWDSTLADGVTPLLGQAPGVTMSCANNTPCLAAAWQNPLLGLQTAFAPDVQVTLGGAVWHPKLVTMLHGRSYADAGKLLTSALQAEKSGGASSEFLFMDGADPARGVLDSQATSAIAELQALGFTANRVPFDSNLTGKTLASFVTGTASLGTTIEGNTFRPGAIVDNLTSTGAAPTNFTATGQSQVSIARWVAMGVAGVQGTVAEPLNNAFPARQFVVDYAEGAPLSEAYLRNMPFAYWRNLVLGDPLAAPYAKRPVVTLDGLTDQQAIGGSVDVTVHAQDLAGTGIAKIRLYVAGVQAAEASADVLHTCIALPAQSSVQVLAVAQNAPGSGALAKFPPKGWVAATVDATSANSTCAQGGADGGVESGAGGTSGAAGGGAGTSGSGGNADAGHGASASNSAGCGCTVAGDGGNGSTVGWLVLCLGFATWRRRRARARLRREARAPA